MNAISSYKKQFIKATNNLIKDENMLFQVKQEMESLQQKKDELERKIEIDQQNKYENGLLYYSGNIRDPLLNQAKELMYSEQAINKLKSIDSQHWNHDYVNEDIINELEVIEKYVNNHTPSWRKSPFAKLGKWINDNGQE